MNSIDIILSLIGCNTSLRRVGAASDIRNRHYQAMFIFIYLLSYAG